MSWAHNLVERTEDVAFQTDIGAVIFTMAIGSVTQEEASFHALEELTLEVLAFCGSDDRASDDKAASDQ